MARKFPILPVLKKIASTTALVGSVMWSTGAALAKDESGFFNLPPSYCMLTKIATISSYIVSITPITITIAASATSGTATISAVTTANTALFFNGFTSADTGPNTTFPYITLTNSTTVTATRNTSSANTVVVKATVVEFSSAALNSSVQYGTITLASVTSNTATISSVTTANTVVLFLYNNTTGSSELAQDYCAVDLTNSTTVTAVRGGGTGTCVASYCVVEFKSALIQSVQQRAPSLSTSATAPTDTISSVTMGNTLLLYQGVSVTGSTAQGAANCMHYLSLTNATTVTMTRTGSNTGGRTLKYTALQFATGVLNSSVQRGTVTLAAVTSNTATISSVTTSKSVVNWLNFNTSVSGNVNQEWPSLVLTNATTVTAAKNTSTGTVISSYEVAEFL